MAAKVATVLITENIYGPTDAYQGSIQRGVSTDGWDVTEVAADNPKSAESNAKITYYNRPGVEIYTGETVAQLVAQSNGTISAS